MSITSRCVVVSVAGWLAAGPVSAFELTPAVQRQLDRQIEVVTGWAASPVIVEAVVAQNRRGPLEGMDNAAWKLVRRSSDVVRRFQTSEAGRFLAQRAAESSGLFPEAFLSAARGEKVAFVEKTTSYVHAGSPKFDVPFTTGKTWQGKPEFDESSQTHQIQIAVPVLSDGKRIGVLVAGVSLTSLEKLARN